MVSYLEEVDLLWFTQIKKSAILLDGRFFSKRVNFLSI
jgi:hypothetical protein